MEQNRRYLIPTIITILAIGLAVGLWVFWKTEPSGLRLEEARTLATATSSECSQKGMVGQNAQYNETTKTWWFDFTPRPEFVQPQCNPACVVNESGKTAEINWRCTGVIPPTGKEDLIQVTSPLPNATVKSPLVVEGKARGTWYFEASFPVKVIDANGTVLGSAPAQAQDEWMTSEFVPFRGTVTFNAPSTPTGTVIFEKDNPSGLPEHADELRIPIRFDTAAAKERTVSLYYYNPANDQGPGGAQCSRNGLVAVQRSIPVTTTPIQDTVNLLLQGQLTEAERAQGITTEFPLPGLTLTGASLNSGVLTLQFEDPQNRTGGGSCRVGILWFQIEATAKQFPEVTEVRFTPEELFQP